MGVVGQPRQMVGEPAEHPGHVLEPVPAADLQHHPSVPRDLLTALDQAGVRPHPARGPVAAHIGHVAAVHRGVDELGVTQDGVHLALREVGVLGGEGVQRGRDHPHSVHVQPVGHVRRPREDRRIGLPDVRLEEPPRQLRAVVARVAPHVTSPHDDRPERAHPFDQPRGLGVVQQNQVTGLHELAQPGEVALEHRLVESALPVCQRAAVALRAVQQVVEALGEPEEVRARVQDQPPGVHPGTPGVGEQGLQHLGHAATGGGGIDVPDGAARQQAAAARLVLGEEPSPVRVE